MRKANMIWIFVCIVFLGCGSPISQNTTQTTPGTSSQLDAIKRRGKLIVGIQFDIPLFGYLNPNTKQVEGFDSELARAIAGRIFGTPDAIEFKETLSKDRIPDLQEGKVDVILATLTANQEREKLIDLSDCYYVAGQSLLVDVNSTISHVVDLSGKKVGVPGGTTSENNIQLFAANAIVQTFDTDSEGVKMLLKGDIDVYSTDDVILFGFQKAYPDKLKMVGGQFTKEPYAVGVQKGNTELLDLVNITIRDFKQSGTWALVYKKWLGDQIPSLPPRDWNEVYSHS